MMEWKKIDVQLCRIDGPVGKKETSVQFFINYSKGTMFMQSIKI